MKKAKNIILLIGVVVIVLSSAFLTYNFFSLLDFTSMDAEHNFYSYQLPMTIISAFLVLPILLFVRNLMEKTGKVLPVVSIVVNSIILILMVVFSFVSAVANFIIVSEVGLTEDGVGYLFNFLSNGTFLIVSGLALVIVGSALSLVKKKV